MDFTKPILEGVFLKRYKRFFADVELNGETVVAHVANSGSMRGCNTPGMPCLISFDDNPSRKLKYTLEMVKTPHSWVGVNTQIPNRIVKLALENNIFETLKDFKKIHPEAKINDKSRLDFALSKNADIEFKKIDLKKGKDKFHFIEVKNVSLVEDKIAKFPDSVTERGQKHLKDLMQLIDWGHTCEILYTIQRTDGKIFSPAMDIDPAYADLLKKAYDYGVTISPYLCDLSKQKISLTNKKLTLHF
jgi:sugar fermentation stimulation protein A